MYGVNVGLEIGKRALMAQQYALNINGNNIANVDTDGYTRQQVMLTTSLPLRAAQGSFGTGVDISGIRRMRSVFLDTQYREESQNLGKWQALEQGWTQIESIYNEPSDTGFSSVMDDFWNSWQDLATDPESQAARVAVKEQANLVTNALHQYSDQLTDLRESLDDDIVTMVDQINTMTTQIASLNQAISSAELTGATANDLRDQRDYLIDQLSGLTNVTASEDSQGVYRVAIGGMAIVEGNNAETLLTTTVEAGATTTHMISLSDTSASINITNGELSGLLELRDEVIPTRQQELDEFALALVDKVNEYHSQGYGSDGGTGRDFFSADTTGAADIELDELVVENDSYIAASLNGEIGDNTNALNIAGLASELTMSNGTATFSDFYASIVGIVGVRSSEAQNMASNQESLVNNIETNRQSVEGVSLDEEMANMIAIEHAYEAAARVITAMDEAMDTIINRMAV